MEHRTKLIAELGNVHLHDIEGCKVAVRDSFNAGADLVKLQVINPLTAYWATKEQFDRYKKIEWPIEVHKRFYAEMNKLYPNRVFASVFDPDYVNSLQSVMPMWKVAFCMRDSQQLVSKMIWTDKPIFFSTRSKVYRQDYERYFTKSKNFIPLFATEYEYTRNLEQNIKQAFAAGNYKGVSINFGGENCINLAKYLNSVSDYIEVHVYGYSASGPDTGWSLGIQDLEHLRLELV